MRTSAERDDNIDYERHACILQMQFVRTVCVRDRNFHVADCALVDDKEERRVLVHHVMKEEGELVVDMRVLFVIGSDCHTAMKED